METFERQQRVIIDPKKLEPITKLQHKNTLRIVEREKLFEKYAKTKFIIELEEYLRNPEWNIYEINNGSLFTIGQYTKHGKIESFELTERGEIFANIINVVGDRQVLKRVNIYDLVMVAVLFKSTDNFDILTDHEFYAIWYPILPPPSIYDKDRRDVFIYEFSIPSGQVYTPPMFFKDMKFDFEHGRVKIFRQFRNASDYMRDNYCYFSYNDILGLFTDDDCKDKLLTLHKSKLFNRHSESHSTIRIQK